MEISAGMEKVMQRLMGTEFYVYGGAVRDMIAGQAPSKCRIAVRLPFTALQKRFAGAAFIRGSVRTTIAEVDCRIIPLSGSIHGICARADFTVNAMAYSTVGGLIDNYGGAADVKNKVIRVKEGGEDFLRENPESMLRTVRCAAELGYTIAEETAELIKRCAVFTKYADRRMLMSEMTKLLLSPNPDYFRILHELGVMRYVLPELDRCFGEEQRNKYHIYDVGEHIMAAVRNTPKDYILRWAALLHDIGKPMCSSTDQNGIIHFYGHHRESRAMADDILHRYGMRRESIREILILIENHDVRVDASAVHVKKMMAKTGAELFDKLMQLQAADNMAKNPKLFPEKYKRISAARNMGALIAQSGEPYCMAQLAVNAKDLMKLGFKPGRDTTDALRIMLDEVIRDSEKNRRDYLINRAREIKRAAAAAGKE